MAIHDYPTNDKLCVKRSITGSERAKDHMKKDGNSNGGNDRRATVTRLLTIFEDVSLPNVPLADMKVLLAFYDTTLSFGTDSFNMAHPWTGDIKQWQFMERPVVTKSGPTKYRIDIGLEEV